MQKRIVFFMVTLCLVSLYSVEGYTVILKNGKTMTGTLVSETGDKIVFRDDHGLQFSLKKTLLDGDKMTIANTPPPAPPPPMEPAPQAPEVQPAPPAKDTHVYTSKDIAPASTSEPAAPSAPAEPVAAPPVPVAPPQAPSSVDSGVDGYYKGLQEVASRLNGVMQQLRSMYDSMNTRWETDFSIGKDPIAGLREYKSGKEATDTRKAFDTEVSAIKSMQGSMSSPPREYQAGYDVLNKVLAGIDNYSIALKTYEGKPAISKWRTDMERMQTTITGGIQQIQAMQPSPAPNQ